MSLYDGLGIDKDVGGADTKSDVCKYLPSNCCLIYLTNFKRNTRCLPVIQYSILQCCSILIDTWKNLMLKDTKK